MLSSKILMVISSIVLGGIGVTLIFFNEEVVAFHGGASQLAPVFHLLGAAYFGFAMTNWTAKNSILGGIYGRAIMVGNFTHYLIASLALLNEWTQQTGNTLLSVTTILFLLLMLSFGYLLFHHPLKKDK